MAPYGEKGVVPYGRAGTEQGGEPVLPALRWLRRPATLLEAPAPPPCLCASAIPFHMGGEDLGSEKWVASDMWDGV